MKCSRCQTELSDSATSCPNCGQPTYRQGQPTGFSYLPAGTPPWPTTVPPRLPFVVDAAPAPNMGTQIAASKAPAQSGRSAGTIIAIIAVLILTPIIGTIATFAIMAANGSLAAPNDTGTSTTNTNVQPTPIATFQAAPTTTTQGTPQGASTPSAQGTAQPASGNFKTTSNSDVNVSLLYPSSWTLQPQQPDQAGDTELAIGPSDSTSKTVFSIIRLSSTISSSFPSADALNSYNIDSLSKATGVHSLQKVQGSGQQPTIGGTKWVQQEAVFTDDSNQKIHFTTISVEHNKLYYTINFYAPDTNYSDSLQKYFTPMLNSLKFLS